MREVQRELRDDQSFSLHVRFHDVANMNTRPMTAVDMLDRAVERLVVAPLLMTCVSSDSLLKSSPVRVTSKKAISYKISTEN